MCLKGHFCTKDDFCSKVKINKIQRKSKYLKITMTKK